MVVAILAILAAIAIPRFGGLTANATDKKNYATAATIAGAAEVYCVDEDVDSVAISNLVGADYLRGVVNDYSNFGLYVAGGEATVSLVAADGNLAAGATLFPMP